MKPSNQGGVSVTRIYIDIDVDEIDIDRQDKIFVQSVYLYIYMYYVVNQKYTIPNMTMNGW